MTEASFYFNDCVFRLQQGFRQCLVDDDDDVSFPSQAKSSIERKVLLLTKNSISLAPVRNANDSMAACVPTLFTSREDRGLDDEDSDER